MRPLEYYKVFGRPPPTFQLWISWRSLNRGACQTRRSDAAGRGAEVAQVGVVEEPPQQLLVACGERVGAPDPPGDLADDRRKRGDALPLAARAEAVAFGVERLVALDRGLDIADEL